MSGEFVWTKLFFHFLSRAIAKLNFKCKLQFHRFTHCGT